MLMYHHGGLLTAQQKFSSNYLVPSGSVTSRAASVNPLYDAGHGELLRRGMGTGAGRQGYSAEHQYAAAVRGARRAVRGRPCAEAADGPAGHAELQDHWCRREGLDSTPQPPPPCPPPRTSPACVSSCRIAAPQRLKGMPHSKC